MNQTIIAMIKRQFRRYFAKRFYFFDLLPAPAIFLLIIFLGLDEIVQLPFKSSFSMFIFPGLIAIYVLGRSFSIGNLFVFDDTAFVKLLKSAPVKRGSIILGFLFAEMLLQMSSVFFFFVIFILVFNNFSILNAALFFLMIIILSLFLQALSMSIAFFLKSIKLSRDIFTLFSFYMIITSGAFYPITNVSSFMKILIYTNPLMYFIDTLKWVLVGIHEINIFLSLSIQLISLTVTLFLSIYLLEKNRFT